MRSSRQPIAVGLVVLVLLSTAVPAVGLSGKDVSDEEAGTATSTEPSEALNRSASARSAKREAIQVVEAISGGWWVERNRARAIDRLNGTLSAYRDEVRVSRSVFSDDRRAIGLIATLAWFNRTATDRAVSLVVSADLDTANTSIEDANRALAQVGGRVEQRDRQRARDRIRSAVRSRNRALSLLGRQHAGGWHSVRQRRALRHLRSSWKQAQRAIDVLDAASDPIVTIEDRSDRPGNASRLGVRTIHGTVSDVRAYELEQVDVTIDGTPRGSAPLNATTAPGRNATFQVTRDIQGPTATVTVSVTDVTSGDRRWFRRDGDRHGYHDRWAKRSVDDRGWSDRFTWWRSDTEHQQTGSAVVRFDGDGLPDTFEVAVVETDPLDPDSDSLATDADEGENGLPDGGEDFDGDGLISFAELTLGTNPLASDSDGDGLPDQVEVDRPGFLDPTDPDADGDGIPDGRADIDGDGLSARAELANGTSMIRSDTDRDGIDDYEEIVRHGTDPTEADSDGDGLGDAEELRLGVDPLDADTDGDGIPDGQERFRTTAVEPATGVSVSLTGAGDLARAVDIEPVDQGSRRPFLASPVVRLKNHTVFEHATVQLPLLENASSEPANLSVYTWSPGTEEPWHSIPSTIDAQNGTIAANVTSFSYFAVMHGDRWRSAISDSVSLGWPRFEPFEDLSGWAVHGDTGLTDGRLVVTGAAEPAPGREILVDQNGGGDFERIQPAVDAAAPGDTVLVNSGSYPETVEITTSIRLLGDNVTLDGTRMAGVPMVGVQFQGDAAVELRGFTIQGYGMPIEDVSNGADVDLADISIRECGVGIYAWDTVGDWTLSNVDIDGCPDGGVYAAYAEGDWTLDDVSVDVPAGGAISVGHHQGDWTLTDVVLSGDTVGIDARDTTGTWSLEAVNASATGDSGIDAADTGGDWTIRESEFSGNDEHGIIAERPRGDWSISNTRVTENRENGIRFETAGGQLTVSRSGVFGNGGTGVAATAEEPRITAEHNWWGQPSGPQPGQVSEGISTTPFCATPDCVSAGQNALSTPREDRLRTQSRSLQIEQRTLESQPGSWARRAMVIPADIDAELTAQVEGSAAEDGQGVVRVVGETESVTLAEVGSQSGSQTASVDVTRFAGQSVTVEVLAMGDATVEVDWLDLALDSDGDGLRDAVEEADLGMPSGPRPGASLRALDPHNPDSDGDGLPDGEELTDVVVRPESARSIGGVSFQVAGASSDPTRENSDGGGLNDAEEVAAGSDPFVLETLVAGYTLPTMTHGPGDTFLDRKPMTVGQSNGILTGGGRDSSFIAWSSRQFFDPIFCIKELTPGPGCAPAWMIGVEQQDGKHYVYIPFIVFAESNIAIRELPYEMSVSPAPGASIVKEMNTSGVVGPGESQEGYVVFEIPDLRAAEEAQPGAFRGVGSIGIKSNLKSTVFSRPETAEMSREFATPTSTLMPATEQLLEDTQFILKEGVNVALAAESGATVAARTGSKLKGSMVFLYELARSQIDSPPVTLKDYARKASQKGISSFGDRINSTEDDIYTELYGRGTVRPVGPTILREN